MPAPQPHNPDVHAPVQGWFSGQEWVHVFLSKPSPLAFPLFVDRLIERLSSESLEDRLKRMAWE